MQMETLNLFILVLFILYTFSIFIVSFLTKKDIERTKNGLFDSTRIYHLDENEVHILIKYSNLILYEDFKRIHALDELLQSFYFKKESSFYQMNQLMIANQFETLIRYIHDGLNIVSHRSNLLLNWMFSGKEDS